MIPQEKHLNHYNLAIGDIHVLILTQQELKKMVSRCPYRRMTDDGAAYYSVPMWEKDYKKLVKSGKVGREVDWYVRS